MKSDAIGCINRNPSSFAHFCKVNRYKGGKDNDVAVEAFYQMHMSRAANGKNPPQITDKKPVWVNRVRGNFGG
ncbi:MAG: hypothetical protein ACRC6V_05695 [Bacteroidales bacterium]